MESRKRLQGPQHVSPRRSDVVRWSWPVGVEERLVPRWRTACLVCSAQVWEQQCPTWNAISRAWSPSTTTCSTSAVRARPSNAISEQSTSSTVWEGLRPHLVHDIGAVDFDGDFADADLAGNLLFMRPSVTRLISSRSRAVSVSKLVRNCCHCSFLFAPDADPLSSAS